MRQLPTCWDDFVEITGRILQAPRGHRWTWQGVRFLALGGACSIDRLYGKLDSGRWGWFKEEVITAQEATQVIAGGPGYVLLTHDAPTASLPQATEYAPVNFLPSVQQSARRVREVAEASKPKLLLHGHWQQFHQVRLTGQDTEVVRLSTDGTRRSWLVVDLPGLEVTYQPQRQRGHAAAARQVHLHCPTGSGPRCAAR